MNTNGDQNFASQPAAAPAGAQEDVYSPGSVDNQGNSDNNQQHEGGQHEGADGPQPEGDDQPFPRKAVNAINRKTREIRKLRAQLRDVERREAELKTSAPAAPTEPSEDGFDNYGDYLKARQDWLNDKTQSGNKAQQAQDGVSSEKQQIRSNLETVIYQETVQQVSTNPEVKQVMANPHVQQILEAMPDSINELLYEIDEPFAAIYGLIRDGRLQDIYSMSPTIAAAELINAQHRGRMYLERSKGSNTNAAPAGSQEYQPPVSQAPRPLAPARQTGSPSKPLHQRSPDEIMDWLKS
jgi:hypothetical protein